VTFTYEDSSHPATLVFENFRPDAQHPLTNCLSGELHPELSPVRVRFFPGARCGASPNTPPPPPLMVDEFAPGSDTIYRKIVLHEITHGLGPDHVSSPVSGGSVSNALAFPHGFLPDPNNPNTNDWQNWAPVNLTDCDTATIKNLYNPPVGGKPPCTQQPMPNICRQDDPCCGIPIECCTTPIVVDLGGNGFDLTCRNDEIPFDIDGDGGQDSITWTAAGADDAWLVLDRNGKGVIDDGSELFGNFTPQPDDGVPNGFKALAEFDAPELGGNNDGLISAADAVFASLQLWRDSNHDGISQRDELIALDAADIRAIGLDYTDSSRRDACGNRFRYRSRVYTNRGSSTGRVAYDVFLFRN
jgi:hypothetical protein